MLLGLSCVWFWRSYLWQHWPKSTSLKWKFWQFSYKRLRNKSLFTHKKQKISWLLCMLTIQMKLTSQGKMLCKERRAVQCSQRKKASKQLIFRNLLISFSSSFSWSLLDTTYILSFSIMERKYSYLRLWTIWTLLHNIEMFFPTKKQESIDDFTMRFLMAWETPTNNWQTTLIPFSSPMKGIFLNGIIRPSEFTKISTGSFQPYSWRISVMESTKLSMPAKQGTCQKMEHYWWLQM